MKTEFIKSIEGSDMGLYDSANGKSIKCKKVVDLTHLAPKSKQLIIKYGKAKRGQIAQINNLYEPNKDLGSVVHYFINEKSAKTLSEEEVFARTARILGASPYDLAVEIYLNVF